jgi:hypothetical protein
MLMLVAISMEDAAPARGDVHARMQVSPGECNGHLGGHTEFHQRSVGELMGGIGSRGGEPHRSASTTFAFWHECC